VPAADRNLKLFFSEDEVQETDSELTYLRLGLKAIEAQCPLDLDDELAQSISNWKTDWASLKKKRTGRMSLSISG
jgi:hypothetical protein